MTKINKIKYNDNDIKSIIKFISYNALYTGIIITIIMIINIILSIVTGMSPIPTIIGSTLSVFVFCVWIISSAVKIKIYLHNKKIE